MSKIEMMEVNQHTSDEVEKVLAELEAQGVDLTAIKEALANSSSGAVKSVQRGTTALSKDKVSVTIAAVDMNKSFVNIVGDTVYKSQYANSKACGAKLTSGTTLDLFAGSGDSSTYANWEVIEFY